MPQERSIDITPDIRLPIPRFRDTTALHTLWAFFKIPELAARYCGVNFPDGINRDIGLTIKQMNTISRLVHLVEKGIIRGQIVEGSSVETFQQNERAQTWLKEFQGTAIGTK